MKTIFYILCLMSLVSCNLMSKSIEKHGGIVMSISLAEGNFETAYQAADIISLRLRTVLPNNPPCMYNPDSKIVSVSVPAETDTALFAYLVTVPGVFSINECYFNTELHSELWTIDQGLAGDSVYGYDIWGDSIAFPLLSRLMNNYDSFGNMNPSASLGFATPDKLPEVMAIFGLPGVREVLPRDVRIIPGKVEEIGNNMMVHQIYAIKTSPPARAITGDMVSECEADMDGRGFQSVSIELGLQYHTLWESMTRDNIGRNLAMVLDDSVYSAPRVNSEIPGGRSMVTGLGSKRDAEFFAAIVKCGTLPVKPRVISAEVVGPAGKKTTRADGKP